DGLAQRGCDAADLVVFRRQQMSAAQHKMNWLVDRSFCRVDDFFDRWMTAADNENNAVRRVDRKRNFLYLQIDAPGPVQQDKMERRRNLGDLAHPGEVAVGPWRPETQRLRRGAV